MKCRVEIHSEAGRLFARLALSIARGIARFYGLRVRVCKLHGILLAALDHEGGDTEQGNTTDTPTKTQKGLKP